MLTWFTGRQAVARFIAANLLTGPGGLRLVPVTANGQPAFAVYQREPGGAYRAHALLVPTVTATGIARIVAFQDPGLFASFGLPPESVPRPDRAGAGLGDPPVAPLSRGLELLEAAVSYALADAVLGTPRLLSHPTPCPGWDLETLLGHVSESMGVLRQAVTGGGVRAAPPGIPDRGGPGRAPARPGGRAAGRLRRCRASRAAGRHRGPRAHREHGRGDRSHRDRRPRLGYLGRVRRLPAGPAGPGGRPAADRPAAHPPGHPARAVRRPGPAARAGLPRRPARRLPRPPAAARAGPGPAAPGTRHPAQAGQKL